MSNRLTVTKLARQAGVSPKAIRYWESLGLLPRASRTHTGYRVFSPEAEQYLRFIVKSKALSLSLAEMRQVLRLARAGRCPCDEVVRWTEQRIAEIETEIRVLSETLRRLRRVTREWRREPSCEPERCGELCSLIDHLPEFHSSKGGKADERMVEVRPRFAAGNRACVPADVRTGRRNLLPAVPALPLPLKRKPRTR